MEIKVSAIRASYVTAHVHDRLADDLGGDAEFAQRLVDLKPICGRTVTLPFTKDLPVDMQFWSRIAQHPVQLTVSPNHAKDLRRAFVPLRWANAVVTGKISPRIEVHLHRFGIVAIATIDLTWEKTVPVEEVWNRLAETEEQALQVTIGTATSITTIRNSSRDFATHLAVGIQKEPSSISTVLSTRRIVTIINCKSDAPLQEMPSDNSPLHIALHRLASGDDAIAAPAAAFVPQWTMAGYAFPPSRMMYALSAGCANLIEPAIRTQSGIARSSDWHRERTLMTAYVCALADLVVTAPSSHSSAFQAWASLGAQTLARLYGPSQNYLEWGQYPAAILARAGAITAVREALGGKLFPNVDFPIGLYPK